MQGFTSFLLPARTGVARAAAASVASMLLGGTAVAQTCVEPSVGLLAWWPGDGDSIDIQSGLHGVALNGAGYADGLVGDAFDFNGLDDGMDDRVDLPAAVLDGITDMTVEMWVQTTDDEGAFLSGASAEGAAFNNEMLLMQATTGTAAIVRQEIAGFPAIDLNDAVWHHLAFVRSGATGTLFIDGVAVETRAVPTEPLNVGPGGLMLGQEQDCLGGCFDPAQALNGKVDELSIYDRALSPDEIVAIFDAAEAGKCKPVTESDLMLQEIDQLESKVELLLNQLADLEAAAQDAVDHPCKKSRDQRGCWKPRKHKKRRH